MDDLVTPQKVVVVGAGPVGCLAALYAADRGDDVEIYELRGDLRDPTTTPLNFTKSINLAISERGINSMRCSKRPGFVEQILSQTIPMHGRMIHGRDKAGTLWENSQTYDVHGRAINALDRSCLNNTLLDELGKLPNVKLFFNHKLTGADFRTNKAWFERRMPGDPTGTPRLRSPDNHRLIALNRAPELEVNFDLLIGADGAHSAARFHMMKFARTDYQQEYIDTLWCEFHIPPTKTDEFRISPNHLHIWPGGQFMFIALPSVDKSFTCTLFAPSSHYDQLKKSPEQLLEFFDVHFPGVCPNLISWDNLLEQFGNNPHLPLISIKCNPYHFNSSVVIVGDAAHAVLPFYGQGLNAGLEDIRVLFETLDSNGVYSEENLEPEKRRAARGRALEAYTQYRKPDAYAINDLSRQNFAEMRQGVRSPLYLLRKNAEEALDKYFPQLGWATQYSRVSFSNLRYSAVIQAAARQGGILSTVASTTAISLVLGGLYAMWKMQTFTLLVAKVPKWFGRSG